MARTKKPPRKFSNTPMTPDLFDILNGMAKDAGTTRAEFTRNLIRERYSEIQEAADQPEHCPHTKHPLEFVKGKRRYEDTYRCTDCGAEFEQVIPY